MIEETKKGFKRVNAIFCRSKKCGGQIMGSQEAPLLPVLGIFLNFEKTRTNSLTLAKCNGRVLATFRF